MGQFLEAALYYASIGWKVFPLMPGQKIPFPGTHGCKDATTDEAAIRGWWRKFPDANIGFACGSDTGIFVVDIDVKGDIDGFRSLREFGQLPETIQQDTPSGGAHLFFSTSNPPLNRNSFRPGIDIRGNGYYVVLPPSVHPNGKSYVWKSGYSPWEFKAEIYPDSLRPRSQQWSFKAPALVKPVPSVVNHPDILERASLYLSQCDPAIQGQGGHDKLLWAAVALVHGFMLPESQAMQLLITEYNPRCVPPWNMGVPADSKDFRRKVSEAQKLTPDKKDGWLLEDESYAPVDFSRINVAAILSGHMSNGVHANAELQQRAELLLAQEPISLSDQQIISDQEYDFLIKPSGMLGEICSWINSTGFREQPFLALACSLAFLGALFGRKVKDAFGSRTNIYCMGVAPSSAGKNHAMSQIRRLCAGSAATELLGGDDIASDSAIEERIAQKPSTLFMWDEIGHLLAHIKSGISVHHAQVVSLLMKLYSAAGNIYLGKEYAEKNKQRVITQPCCCVYGTSTTERFTQGISPSELQDGWLGRCLVFQSTDVAAKKRGRHESPVPDHLIELVKRWKERIIAPPPIPSLTAIVGGNYEPIPEQLVVPTDQHAERVFIRFDMEAEKQGKLNPKMACLWAKGEENARRIALICAASESFENPTITESIADYSCRLMRYLLVDFCVRIVPEVVSCPLEANKRKVIAVVRSFGASGCIRSDITKATPNLNQKLRKEIIEDLTESGELAYRQIAEKSAPIFKYWTAENYLKLMK